VFALAGVALAYGFVRYDLVRLPPGARSPLYGLQPGDRMVVDRQARGGAEGEIWLFRNAQGELLLGRVTPRDREGPAAAEGALWLTFEREVRGLSDSRELGAIPREGLEGRVVFVLPW
jgi:hypothetical protein